jgi:hypothetical protein
MEVSSKDKSSRGNASQFFIARELCRRGYSAVVTWGTPLIPTSSVAISRELASFIYRSKLLSQAAEHVASA